VEESPLITVETVVVVVEKSHSNYLDLTSTSVENSIWEENSTWEVVENLHMEHHQVAEVLVCLNQTSVASRISLVESSVQKRISSVELLVPKKPSCLQSSIL